MPLFRCLEFANGKGEQKDFYFTSRNLKKVGKSLLTILVRFYIVRHNDRLLRN
jgi:hypothetical protein